MPKKYLIIVAGPTAVGKTSVAVEIASKLTTEIINADSRQIYREMKIGTAVPSDDQQSSIKHHLLAHRSVREYYNASMYEVDVIGLLKVLFNRYEHVVMSGGSGMYIRAVCSGIDNLPAVDREVRSLLRKEFNEHGKDFMLEKLKRADPAYYDIVDRNNPKRILKALEVYAQSGYPYSSFLTGSTKNRDFSTIKIGLDRDRNDLHNLINTRVDQMMKAGLLDEVSKLYPYRHLNALNTVGYKELFAYMDGCISLEEAVDQVKSHSRQYARRQLTWFRKDREFRWFHPDDLDTIMDYIYQKIRDRGATGNKTF
jgi:tRNA dimethylallyltransferase